MRNCALLLVFLIGCKPVVKLGRILSENAAGEAKTTPPATDPNGESLKSLVYFRFEFAQKSASASQLQLSELLKPEELLTKLRPVQGCVKDVNKVKTFEEIAGATKNSKPLQSISTSGFAQGIGTPNSHFDFSFVYNLLQFDLKTWDFMVSDRPVFHAVAPAFFKSVDVSQKSTNFDVWNTELLNPSESQTVQFNENIKVSWELNNVFESPNETSYSQVMVFLKSQSGGQITCAFSAEKGSDTISKDLFSTWTDPEISLSIQLQNVKIYPTQSLLIASYDWRYSTIKP